MSSSKARQRRTSAEPLRFAHPYFTDTPSDVRARAIFGPRMLDHIAQNLQPVPKPSRTPIIKLGDIIGATAANDIEKAGTLSFHVVGDTGRRADSPQGQVAAAMAADFDLAQPAASPAFFFHLGDVIYGAGKDARYRQESYEPYMHYPGKIIAIPGNHDGEVIPSSDPATLRAFLANFCAATATVPPIAGTILRQTMTQPGVYWRLETPFADIIGLYSNVAENPGFISGPIPGSAQKTWLVSTLKQIAAGRQKMIRRALIFATHHPPFSAAGHSGSVEMLADIDDACAKGGVMPDLFLSGHSHTYQRYARHITFNGAALEIPFIVAGIGGINDLDVAAPTGKPTGDHLFVLSRKGYGYLLISVSKTTIEVRAIGVDGVTKAEFDRVAVTM